MVSDISDIDNMVSDIATVATLLRSCVAQALSRGDGPRNSLHASAYYGEYNEDLILILMVSDLLLHSSVMDCCNTLGTHCAQK